MKRIKAFWRKLVSLFRRRKPLPLHGWTEVNVDAANRVGIATGVLTK